MYLVRFTVTFSSNIKRFLILLSRTFFLKHAAGSILNSRAKRIRAKVIPQCPTRHAFDVRCLLFSDSRPFFYINLRVIRFFLKGKNIHGNNFPLANSHWTTTATAEYRFAYTLFRWADRKNACRRIRVCFTIYFIVHECACVTVLWAYSGWFMHEFRCSLQQYVYAHIYIYINIVYRSFLP